MSIKYNHAYTLAFSLESSQENGGDVTPTMMKKALEQRIRDLDQNEEWEEAVGCPYDSYEV